MQTLGYLFSIAWKELQLIAKDRGALGVYFLLPVLLGSLIAAPNLMAARNQAETNISLDVTLVNLDTGAFGIEVARALNGIEVLRLTTATDAAAAEEPVSQGKATAAIIIPADFTDRINAYEPTAIDVIADSAEPEAAGIVTGIIQEVVGEVTIWGEVQYGVRTILDNSNLLSDATPQQRRALEAQNMGVIMTRLAEARRNPLINVRSEDLAGVSAVGGIRGYLAYVFPAFTVMFVFFIIGSAASSLLRERETGVLRRLTAAPIPRGAIIAGKMLAYMLIPCLQVVLLFSLGHFAFEIPLGNSPLALVVLTLALAFTATALAMLLAALVRTAQQADNLGTIIGFVLAGVSGAIPASNALRFFESEGVMGTLSRLTPHGQALNAFLRVMTGGATLADVWPHAIIIVGMGLAFYALARWRFRFQV